MLELTPSITLTARSSRAFARPTLLAYLLAGVFACCMACGMQTPLAFAEPVDGQAGMEQSLAAADNAAAQAESTRTDLARAKEELATKTEDLKRITGELEEAQGKVDVIKEKIDLLKESITETQKEHAKQQKRLSDVMVVMYKTDAVGILEIITGSEDINQMLARIHHAEAIAGQAADFAATEAETAEQLQESYREVSQLMNEAEQARSDLQKKHEEATRVADDLEQRVAGLQAEVEAAEQRAALQAARAQASAAAQTFQTEGLVAAPAPAAESGGAAEGEAGGSGGEAGDQSAAVEQDAGQEVASSSGGWATGVASAYGGASDSMTPNPSATATGAIADDYSMGVAVPMVWGPEQYYGRMIEISYGGQSVIATVNDCGDMGGGSRALDLQPGVFKAFGASTCDEWGLRTVAYRFL